MKSGDRSARVLPTMTSHGHLDVLRVVLGDVLHPARPLVERAPAEPRVGRRRRRAPGRGRGVPDLPAARPDGLVRPGGRHRDPGHLARQLRRRRDRRVHLDVADPALLRTTSDPQPRAKYFATLAIYLSVAIIGAYPEIAKGIGILPIQAEAILLILLVLVGHGLVGTSWCAGPRAVRTCEAPTGDSRTARGAGPRRQRPARPRPAPPRGRRRR